MLSKFRKDEQGFTLIELLIVVAIIGILAAIAIPQFAAYRMRGYNSTALSDLRNFKTAQESLWGDNQCYGEVDGGLQAATVVIQTAVSGAAGNATFTGPISPASMDNTAAGGRIAGTNAAGAQSAIPMGVSNGVNLYCATTLTGTHYDSYVMASRHNDADASYGADSDNGTSIYRVSNTTWAGAAGVRNTIAATVPAASVGADNFGPTGTVAGGGSPTAEWTVL
nr:prepilin-type N-terminal cleavage/methylation domain-containing protein [Desulfuromonas thiophila]